ncbi:methyl-accepting chemotaxis sensory transducer with Cache sensor [Anaerobranca californiensis DSM 14826]|uniref:Methyl-accepting chemotaxis sensory transducer with Cache sensor n=1 Tax=Anaerobranca californiensis DSM 14826 TaxID=1120989 RepID=A0A1M6MA12_9FIRM|nr:methyl-accepting chemotaxis protein [Anaerobranca californiensis]SHJ80316.1 methyl-accepting chemotaxis sensory transducer with Cache sensor [Anaerobranca californiensis DSM 14826]
MFLKAKKWYQQVRGKLTRGIKYFEGIKKIKIRKPNLTFKKKNFVIKKPNFKGLYGKILTITVGIVVITVAILLSVSLPTFYSHTIKQAEENQLIMAERLSDGITDYLKELESLSSYLSQLPDLRKGDFVNARRYFLSMAVEDNRVNRMTFYDLEGNRVFTSGGQEQRDRSPEGFDRAKRGEIHKTDFFLGVGNNPIMIISSPVYDYTTNEIIGVFEVEYNIRMLWSNIYQYNLGTTGGAMILDSSGTIISHRENARVYNKLNIKEILPWEEMAEKGRGNIEFEDNGRIYLAAYSRVPGFNWQAVIFQGRDELSAPVMALAKNIIKIALLLALAAIIITLIFVTKTFSPLKILEKGARGIAAGDLTQNFQVKTKDEIGELAKTFNTMVSSLKEIIGNSLESAEITEKTAKELSIAANEAALASQQIATTVEEVAKGAEQQTVASQRVVEKINNVAIMAKDIAERASTATKVNQEMVVTIEENTRIMVELISALKEIVAGNIQVSNNINELERDAQKVSKIITVVTEIASQTNLLSLNAAIEAARAGEHGRGFAVVADEVRKLSDETRKAADDIKKIVSGIQSQISKTAQTINNQSSKAQGQLELIDNANKALDVILEISKITLESISEISSAAQKQSEEVEQVVADSRQVAYVAEQTSASSQEVAATTQEQTASLEEITAATSSLAEVAGELRKLVNKFTI